MDELGVSPSVQDYWKLKDEELDERSISLNNKTYETENWIEELRSYGPLPFDIQNKQNKFFGNARGLQGSRRDLYNKLNRGH